jgi:acyl carrier protein phosphodiesterase
VNFLGHIFLTPDDDELLLGNFIADSVKGNPLGQFPKRVVEGIRLHRVIDEFTDKHEIVRQGVSRFKPTQGRYASVVIDVVYDHVLANNWQEFHH